MEGHTTERDTQPRKRNTHTEEAFTLTESHTEERDTNTLRDTHSERYTQRHTHLRVVHTDLETCTYREKQTHSEREKCTLRERNTHKDTHTKRYLDQGKVWE